MQFSQPHSTCTPSRAKARAHCSTPDRLPKDISQMPNCTISPRHLTPLTRPSSRTTRHNVRKPSSLLLFVQGVQQIQANALAFHGLDPSPLDFPRPWPVIDSSQAACPTTLSTPPLLPTDQAAYLPTHTPSQKASHVPRAEKQANKPLWYTALEAALCG
jgi:hypothetical protein